MNVFTFNSPACDGFRNAAFDQLMARLTCELAVDSVGQERSVRLITSFDLRETKPSAEIKIVAAAAWKDGFEGLRIDALSGAKLCASTSSVRAVRAVRARCEKLPKRRPNRDGAPCDTVLALSCPTTPRPNLPPQPPDQAPHYTLILKTALHNSSLSAAAGSA